MSDNEVEAGSLRAIMYSLAVVLFAILCVFDELIHAFDATPIGDSHWAFRYCQWVHGTFDKLVNGEE